jgi:cysteine-rich repeat protein
VTDAGEECDDGNIDDTDGCTVLCTTDEVFRFGGSGGCSLMIR